MALPRTAPIMHWLRQNEQPRPVQLALAESTVTASLRSVTPSRSWSAERWSRGQPAEAVRGWPSRPRRPRLQRRSAGEARRPTERFSASTASDDRPPSPTSIPGREPNYLDVLVLCPKVH